MMHFTMSELCWSEVDFKEEILETAFKNKQKKTSLGIMPVMKMFLRKEAGISSLIIGRLLSSFPSEEYEPQYVKGRKDHRIGFLA